MTETIEKPRNERPVLVLGAPRSGTSLMSRQIDAHPRITIPFESHLFAQWLPRVDRYGDLSVEENRRALVRDIIDFGVVHDWEPRPVLDEVMPLVTEHSFGGVTRGLMDWWAAQEGKPRWGEKTPWHLLMHREIRAAWPDALIVLLHRDPRDVSLSWKEARFHGKHVQKFAESWVRHQKAAQEVLREVPEEDVIVVAYEDVVRDPEGQLTRLMNFMGEDYDPVQLDFHRNETAYQTDARNESQLRRPISQKSVGRWKTGLSAREIRLIETVARDEMQRLGYELASDRQSVPGWEKALVKYVEQPASRLPDVFRNRQGYMYLARDLAYKARLYRRGPAQGA